MLFLSRCRRESSICHPKLACPPTRCASASAARALAKVDFGIHRAICTPCEYETWMLKQVQHDNKSLPLLLLLGGNRLGGGALALGVFFLFFRAGGLVNGVDQDGAGYLFLLDLV